MAPKPVKDTKPKNPQVDDSAEAGPSSSSSQSSSQSQEPEIPLAEEADDDIIFLREVQKPKTSATKESVKEEDESGEDSDESEELDSDGDSDDQGESDDSENIESDEEGEKEEREESNDESENEENESDDSSIEILENDEDPEDDEEEEDDLEDDSDDEENEEEQEEEGGDSRVARSRRVPPASNDQVLTTSTNRKRKRSPSIEIVEEQSTSRRSQTTPKKQKKGRLEVQEDNQERVTGEEEAEDDEEEAQEVSDNSDESDDSNDEEDEEDEDRIDANYIRRFLNHSIQQNPLVFANLPNVSDFINYTMNFIGSNQELLNDVTSSDQRLFTWYNENFVIGFQNWMEYMNDPETFEDLHRNRYEHSIEDDGTFVSVPLDPMPVLFPSEIQARLIERAREQHDWIVDHREAQYLMVLQRGREVERRGEEVRNLIRRNAELLEEINESRRQ